MITLLITLGWIILCFLCHTIGWREGVAQGCSLTIDELTKANIIVLDRKGDIISPGTAQAQSLKSYAESINSSEDIKDL